MEEWKNGGVEERRSGRMEDWKRMEEWKIGRMEDWKIGGMETTLPPFQHCIVVLKDCSYSTIQRRGCELPLFHPCIKELWLYHYTRRGCGQPPIHPSTLPPFHPCVLVLKEQLACLRIIYLSHK